MRSRATRDEEITKLRQSPSFHEIFGEDADVPANWLLSRAEMRARPPHILITNYAMLEHILLLPTNRPLLERAKLRWIVLDEIHTYAGAQAIEVSFLLRRLKQHLGTPDGQLRTVGTSASLDPGRKAELADFASRLFGEPFGGGEAVITSEPSCIPRLPSLSDRAACRPSAGQNAEKKAAEAEQVPLRAVMEAYVNRPGKLKPSSAAEVRRHVEQVFAAWLDKPIASITEDDIRKRHREMATKGLRGKGPAPGQANLSMTTLRALINFASR